MSLLSGVALAVCLVAPTGKPQLEERPVIAGEVLHDTPDGRFRIHYTLAGRDALVPAAAGDEDPANGVPDSVDWAAEGATRMVGVFVGEDGWPAPVSDEGNGGDDRLDLYLRRLDPGANGYAHSEITPGGNVSGYIEVTPDAAAMGKIPFQSVVGHEVFHILELATGRNFVASWIAEASATYAQYLVHTGEDRFLRLAREALWQVRLLGSTRELDDLDGTFEYAGMVWVKYLIDRGGGDRKLLLKLWQAMAAERNWVRGHDAALPAHFGVASLDEAIAEFAVWNWFACKNDDGRHYDMSTNGCSVALGLSGDPAGAPPSSGTSPMISFRGSSYLAVAPDCTSGDLALRFTPDGRMRFQLLAEAVSGESPVTTVTVDAGAEGTLSLAGWNRHRRAVLIATSLGLVPATFQWSAQVSGSYTPGPAQPPRVLALAGPALALVEGDDRALVATADYGSCEDGRDVTAEVAWTSSDPRVATVVGGRVEAVGPGTAEVFATLGAVTSNKIVVTVSAAPSDGGCEIGGGGGAAWWMLVLLVVEAGRLRRRRAVHHVAHARE